MGAIEHSIEKTLSAYLEECVPNMAIACSNCNQSLKRVGEKKRKDKIRSHVQRFEKDLACQKAACKRACGAYVKLRKQYCQLNQLNLQPFGMIGEVSGLEYRIQYDIMSAEFIPSRRYAYDDKDIAILEYHIRQFKLNDADYKTEAMIEFIEDTIEADGKYSRHENRYSNYIVDLFVEKLKGYSPEEVLKICKRLYVNYQLRHIARKANT